MDADHPVVIGPALAALSGVAHGGPCAPQRAIQHSHRALRVHGTRCSCAAYKQDSNASSYRFQSVVPFRLHGFGCRYDKIGRLTFRTEAHPCQVGLAGKRQGFTVDDLLSFLAKLQKLHPKSLITVKPSPLYGTRYYLYAACRFTTRKTTMQATFLSYLCDRLQEAAPHVRPCTLQVPAG